MQRKLSFKSNEETLQLQVQKSTQTLIEALEETICGNPHNKQQEQEQHTVPAITIPPIQHKSNGAQEATIAAVSTDVARTM